VEINTETCKHQPVYFGVVNININQRTLVQLMFGPVVYVKKDFVKKSNLVLIPLQILSVYDSLID